MTFPAPKSSTTEKEFNGRRPDLGGKRSLATGAKKKALSYVNRKQKKKKCKGNQGSTRRSPEEVL